MFHDDSHYKDEQIASLKQQVETLNDSMASMRQMHDDVVAEKLKLIDDINGCKRLRDDIEEELIEAKKTILG